MTALVDDQWHIAVVIPARDEEQLLPRCLRSIAAARERLASSCVTSDVVVVSDCSVDRTWSLATDLLGDRGVVVCSSAGRVGSARGLGCQTALARYLARCRGPQSRCWLANTDADCMVPADWLQQQLAIAERGHAAVAGTIDVDSYEGHDEEVAHLFRSTYHIGADGTHGHVHGANLGVRADVYLNAGGWADLATGEDHDLWARLRGAGHSLLSTNRVQVTTSGRRIGRAPSGFAEALAAHNRTAA